MAAAAAAAAGAQEAEPGDEVGADARVVGGADGDPEDEDEAQREDGTVPARRGDPDDGVDERAGQADARRRGDRQRPHAGHAVRRHGRMGGWMDGWLIPGRDN